MGWQLREVGWAPCKLDLQRQTKKRETERALKKPYKFSLRLGQIGNSNILRIGPYTDIQSDQTRSLSR